MRACLRSLIVIAAAAVVGAGAVSAVWAQSDWKAPADAKAMKNPRADKKTDKQDLQRFRWVQDLLEILESVRCSGGN